MKRTGIIIALSTFAVAAFTQKLAMNSHVSIADDGYKFPKKVKEIIDNRCYGCHSADGKSDKAKKALRWDMMQEYDKAKLVSVMDDIIEVIEKREMPPEKFLEKKPEAKPTDEEYAKLLKWAEKEADKILQ